MMGGGGGEIWQDQLVAAMGACSSISALMQFVVQPAVRREKHRSRNSSTLHVQAAAHFARPADI